VTVGALPAAATSCAVQYVAFGDYYAAGQAAGSYPDCPHSGDGYPALHDSEQSYRHLLEDRRLSAPRRSATRVSGGVGGAACSD
jgi:hypothetical protein